MVGGGGGGVEIYLLGYDFGSDNASLNPHEHFKVGVQAYGGATDCYANLCELT